MSKPRVRWFVEWSRGQGDYGCEPYDVEEDARAKFDEIAEQHREDLAEGNLEVGQYAMSIFCAVEVAAAFDRQTASPGDGTEDGERCAANGWDAFLTPETTTHADGDVVAALAEALATEGGVR